MKHTVSRPSQWGLAEVEPRHLPWWGTQPSFYKNHGSTLPSRWRVPTGGAGLFCSSEPAGIPAPSRWSWRLEAAPPTGKAVQPWQCCWTMHRWSTAPCCKQESVCDTLATHWEYNSSRNDGCTLAGRRRLDSRKGPSRDAGGDRGCWALNWSHRQTSAQTLPGSPQNCDGSPVQHSC